LLVFLDLERSRERKRYALHAEEQSGRRVESLFADVGRRTVRERHLFAVFVDGSERERAAIVEYDLTSLRDAVGQ